MLYIPLGAVGFSARIAAQDVGVCKSNEPLVNTNDTQGGTAN